MLFPLPCNLRRCFCAHSRNPPPLREPWQRMPLIFLPRRLGPLSDIFLFSGDPRTYTARFSIPGCFRFPFPPLEFLLGDLLLLVVLVDSSKDLLLSLLSPPSDLRVRMQTVPPGFLFGQWGHFLTPAQFLSSQPFPSCSFFSNRQLHLCLLFFLKPPPLGPVGRPISFSLHRVFQWVQLCAFTSTLPSPTLFTSCFFFLKHACPDDPFCFEPFLSLLLLLFLVQAVPMVPLVSLSRENFPRFRVKPVSCSFSPF